MRNAGSWAGNLMMFLKYPTFPSDAVLALATANAQLHVCNNQGQVSFMDMQTFLSQTLDSFQAQGFMLISLTIRDVPVLAKRSTFSAGPGTYSQLHTVGPSQFVTETFKVAQRARNAHAHVNAGFQFEIEAPKLSYTNPATGTRSSSGPPTCRSARVVYGGVSNTTFIAYRCQNVLINAPLTSETLSRALVALQLDLTAVGASQDVLGDQKFRESAMQAFLYRALLRCYSAFSLPSSLSSAVMPWVMPISRGVELFMPPTASQSVTSTPVGMPVRKLEAKIQATGEAKYPSDEVMPPQGLFGALIFSTACAKRLVSMDTSAALALPGVVSILTAVDIPGENVGSGSPFLFVPVGEMVETVGAQLGVVVATSEAAANQAASMVVCAYQAEAGVVPVVDLQQAIAKKSFFPNGEYFKH